MKKFGLGNFVQAALLRAQECIKGPLSNCVLNLLLILLGLSSNMNREVGFVSVCHGSLSSAPLRNLNNIIPDPLCCPGHTQSETPAMRLCLCPLGA
jgi:hypothetical protein